MYISVTAGEGHGDFLQDVGEGPIESGTVALEWNGGSGGVEILDKLAKAIGIVWVQSRLLDIDPDQRTDYERNKDWIAVRYAWWQIEGTGAVGVATTRNIFITGDDGKTIGKVR